MSFEGKVLVINTIGGGGSVIENAEIRQIGGECFIVGTATLMDDDGPNWHSGLKVWVSLKNVTTITEVPSSDEYVRRCKIHNMPQPFRLD